MPIFYEEKPKLAEREGFEPPVRLHVLRISSAARSTTLPPLHGDGSQICGPSGRSRALARARLRAQALRRRVSVAHDLPGSVWPSTGSGMRRSEALQGVRAIKFTSISSRYHATELNQIEAAELLGIDERTFRRWRQRFEDEAGLLDRRQGKASRKRPRNKHGPRLLRT